MPDGSNLSSVPTDPNQQYFLTPDAAQAASDAPPLVSPQAPQASSTPDPNQQYFLTPEAAQAASTPAPAAQPAAADPNQQYFLTPEAAQAASGQPPGPAQPGPAQPGPGPGQDQSPQETGFFSGLTSGAGAAIREGGQTLSGQAFTTDPNAQPEPTRGFFNEVGYGIGHSFPVIGAGMAGGALGGMAGPVGAVAGAAGGVGAMSAAQALAPAYASGIQQGMSHDDAVNYAIKQAAAQGALGAATAPLFELAPFKSLVGKLLFSSLVTQPTAGAASRVGVPLLTGDPLPSAEDLAKGYGQDVASGVAFGVGHELVGAGKRIVTPRPAETPPPPPEDTEPPSPPGVPAQEPPLPPAEMTPSPPSPAGTPAEQPPPLPPAEMTPPPAAPVGKPAEEPPLPPAEMGPQGVAPRAEPPVSTPVEEPPSPSPETPQAVMPPVDDGSGVPPGPEPAAGVGETGAQGLSAAQPGGGGAGDTPVGTGDTPPAPPPSQGQAGQTEPSAAVAPPHEFTGQTTYSGSGRADQASAYNPLGAGVPIAGEGRYSAFDRSAAERYGPNIAEHPIDLQNPLIIKSDQEWRALTREAGWPVPNPTGLPKDQVLGMTQRLKQVVQAKGHDGIIVHWDDRTPYDIDSQGRDIKLLRNVFDTPQVIDYGRSQQALATARGDGRVPPAVAPGKRAVTSEEHATLVGANNKARQALAKAERDPATTQDQLDVLRQRVQATQEAWTQAQGPPTKATYQRPGQGPTDQQHAQALEAHQAAVDARIHEEGETPVPSPQDAGKVFRLGGESRAVVRGTDPQGNTWVGTGNVMVNNGVLDKGATAAGKLKTAPDPLTPASAALGKVTAPKPNVDYQPVTFGRRITADGMDQVVGQRADGTHLSVQKPVYDALHAAAGPGGTVVSGPGGKKADDRLFARDAQGKTVGVGMPVRVDEARARTWMHGPEETPAPQTLADIAPGEPRQLPGAPRPDQDQQPTPAVPGPDLMDPTAAHNHDIGPGTNAIPDELQPPGAARPDMTPPPPAPGGRPAEATPTSPQLERLEAFRNDPATPASRLAALDRQILAVRQTLDTKGGPRVGGRKIGYRGPPAVGATADPIRDYKFNNGTSVYTSVFEQAGHDPRTAVNKPIAWQNRVLTRHAEDSFGFKSVELAPDNKGMVDQKIARDALLDLIRATQDMMSSIGLPYESASLNGRLKLVLDPEGKRSYYGQYSTAGEIRLTGGANSFGHEWTHAVDHMLAERLTGNPGLMNTLLTRYARAGQLDPKDGVQGAMARLINTMFYDKAAQAAREITLQHQAAAVDRVGNPTQGAKDAQAKLAQLEAAGSRLRIKPSDYREAALRSAKPDYYADPAELLARAHEAWLARQMQNEGADPRGAVMPDEAYIRETSRQLADYYPQDEDRMNIFSAIDDLHAAMLREDVLGEGHTPQGPSDLSISDPTRFATTVPLGTDPHAVQQVTGIVNRYKNQARNLLNSTTALMHDASRPIAEHSLWTRAQDIGRMVTFSHHGIMDTIITRAPKAAQPLLREMLNRVAAAPGEGRLTHENFEEAVRRRGRGWTTRFGNILRNAGYKDANTLTVEDGEMLRHALTTGETSYPLDPNDISRTGPGKPIPDHLTTAAGHLRQLMDEIWRETHDAGIDVGYARSGYYPRLYDALKVTADEGSKNRFLDQAQRLHQHMFDQELGPPGSDPTALLEKWTTLPKTDQNLQPIRGTDTMVLQGHMNELRQNLRRQAEIAEQLKAGPNPTLEAELGQRKDEARQIAEAAHDMLRDHVSALAANEWLTRIKSAGMHDFDSTGPSGKYLQARVLPPEADQIMREFMRTSPTDALPNYFHAAARRISYAERFGANGEELDAMMTRIHDIQGMNTEDANWFRQQIDTVTGQQNTSGMRGLMKLSNFIHAAGSVALMPRAPWSALTEPMNTALATGSMRAALETFGNQFGQFFKTASARERTELAEYLTTVASGMHDSIMMSRMSADYSDSPTLNRFMTAYYRITGLTQLTNSQRVASTAAMHGFLAKLSRDYQGNGVNSKEDAARWFRELGLGDQIHGDFAKWMTGFQGGRPTVAQLKTDPMAGAYSLAVRRLVDRSVQDPYKVDRAALSSVPFVGLAFQLMSFNYQFQRNVLQPAMDQMTHNYQRGGLLAATGSAVHAATMAGAMVGAGVVTSALRQLLFAPDQWRKHSDDGDLAGYITDLAMQRSGLNGTLDPLIQIGTNLRYDANVSSLIEGASINWMAKNLQDIVGPLATANDSPNSNTRYFNAARGAFNLLGVPVAAAGLTGLGAVGGPLTKFMAGAALQFGTSPAAAAGFAESVAGPKGATREKPETGGLPALPGLPTGGPPGSETQGEGPAQDFGGGMIPWNLADDVAKPAWQVAGEPVAAAFSRLPGPLKALGAAGVAAYGAKSFLDTTEPWRNQPAPPPKGQGQPGLSP